MDLQRGPFEPWGDPSCGDCSMPYVDLVYTGIPPWCGETWRDVEELVASVFAQHQMVLQPCGEDFATAAPLTFGDEVLREQGGGCRHGIFNMGRTILRGLTHAICRPSRRRCAAMVQGDPARCRRARRVCPCATPKRHCSPDVQPRREFASDAPCASDAPDRSCVRCAI